MKKILIIFVLMAVLITPLALANSKITNLKNTLQVENFKETKSVSCEDVLTSNTVLTSDLTCAGEGLIIGANGITLDCDGYSINYGNSEEGDGVQIVGYNNVEVRNCDIIRGSASGDSNIGVRLQDAPNTLIEFNNISTKGFVNYCIAITNSGNSIIQYNSIYHNEDGTRGIILGGNQENIQIKNNQITSLDNVPLSIEINSDSIYTNITNNVIYSEFDAIKLGTIGSHPEGTIIEGNTITASGYDLIINANIDDVTLIDQPIDKYDINNAKIQIKKTELGEVWFDERMTVSGDNLDEDVSIEDNSISVDIINKPGFNVSGHIVLYEPTTQFFAPYYAMKDNSRCTAPYGDVCTNYENEGEEFSFNVSEMALEFSIEGSSALVVESKEETDDVSCEDVLTSNTVLTSDLTCDATGLIIGANNIVLDCDGHSITHSNSEEGAGILIEDSSNNQIKNCDIIKGSWSGQGYGIVGYNSDNILIENNTILDDNSYSSGIVIHYSDNIEIKNNEVSAKGEDSRGISYGTSSSGGEIIANIVSCSGNNCAGIALGGNNQNSKIENNTINGGYLGIMLSGEAFAPEDSLVKNNDINSITQYELYANQHIKNLILEDQNIGSYYIENSMFNIKNNEAGMVKFSEYVTISGDNLDEDVKIANNNISIDIVNKPGLNVSGSIVLYEPTTQFFAPYYAMKDNSRCTAPYGDVCTNYENEGEEFSFNVSEMALEFSIEGSSDLVPDGKENKNEIKVIKELEKDEIKISKQVSKVVKKEKVQKNEIKAVKRTVKSEPVKTTLSSRDKV